MDGDGSHLLDRRQVLPMGGGHHGDPVPSGLHGRYEIAAEGLDTADVREKEIGPVEDVHAASHFLPRDSGDTFTA